MYADSESAIGINCFILKNASILIFFLGVRLAIVWLVYPGGGVYINKETEGGWAPLPGINMVAKFEVAR